MTMRGSQHLLVVGLGCLLGVTQLPHPASSHSFDPALLMLRERTPGLFGMTWKITSTLDASANSPALTPRLPPHCRVVAEARADASEGSQPPSASTVDCRPGGLRGETLFIDGLEASQADAVIRIVWLDGDTSTGVVHRSQNDFLVPAAANALGHGGSLASTFGRYVLLGTEHILLGFDHLLFVLGLTLLVRDTRTLIKTITAFTVAHSMTLALAVLGILQISPAPVEATIALSILLLAVEVARDETGFSTGLTLTRRFPWVVAFAFGLLHGLGFAGALMEIGLPREQMALSLFAFNVGVEAGQLAFVITLTLMGWAWTRVRPATPWLRLAPAYVMGTLAMAWTLERLAGVWGP